MKPHRSVAAAAANHIATLEDRIAQLELVRDSLARELAAAIVECEQLRVTLDRVNEGMQRRLDRIQADRVRQVQPELVAS